MKVLIGTFQTAHGTVETTPDGLVYAGAEPERVQGIVESVREWYDQIGIVHKLTDAELVESLPYRLQSYILWALFVDPVTGLTTVPAPSEIWRPAAQDTPA